MSQTRKKLDPRRLSRLLRAQVLFHSFASMNQHVILHFDLPVLIGEAGCRAYLRYQGFVAFGNDPTMGATFEAPHPAYAADLPLLLLNDAASGRAGDLRIVGFVVPVAVQTPPATYNDWNVVVASEACGLRTTFGGLIHSYVAPLAPLWVH